MLINSAIFFFNPFWDREKKKKRLLYKAYACYVIHVQDFMRLSPYHHQKKVLYIQMIYGVIYPVGPGQ